MATKAAQIAAIVLAGVITHYVIRWLEEREGDGRNTRMVRYL